jgi:hypothetical protein
MGLIDREIEADLTWREGELISLKRLVISNSDKPVEQMVLLRALSTLLYAHYEGFCKHVWNRYIEYLNRTGAKRTDCKKEFVMLSMEPELGKLRSLSIEQIWDYCHGTFSAQLGESISFSKRFKTSNLTVETLREHCQALLLPHSYLDEHAARIELMIHRRHNVAHGQGMAIRNLNDYLPYERAAFLVMVELGVAISDAVDRKHHLL